MEFVRHRHRRGRPGSRTGKDHLPRGARTEGGNHRQAGGVDGRRRDRGRLAPPPPTRPQRREETTPARLVPARPQPAVDRTGTASRSTPADMTVGLCTNCRKVAEVVRADSRGLEYCVGCVAQLPGPSVARALGFLMRTVPFRPGDQVECRLAGLLYEGIGVVRDISFSLEDGGSLIYPSFKVALMEKAYPEVPDEAWYTEICLRQIASDVAEGIS